MRALPGIGHNRGPGFGWRRHAWARAKADAAADRAPLETIRRRMRRAEALGLTYPQYASILRSAGRDPRALVFTAPGAGIGLGPRLSAPAHVRAKIGRLEAGPLFLTPWEEPAEPFRAELEDALARAIPHAAESPRPEDPWGAQRRAVRKLLDQARLPSDAVLLIGDGAEEPWAGAGRLAGFVAGADYFPAR